MKYIKIILMVLGAIFSLLIFVPTVVGIFYSYTNTNKSNFATKGDVDFVLNWIGLGANRIETVLNSTKSARSLTGDHLDAYEIKISHVSEIELQDPHSWSRGDKINTTYKDGIDFVTSWIESDKIAWFPDYDILTSDKCYVFSWSILYHGKNPTSAKMIFVIPSKNLVYYVSAKT